ncbi:MAG: hypothetical protein Q9163_004740 [Psora crenata]
MPGVPPDALAQVKKGLRGLFSRRKSKGQQPTPATTATSSTPSTTATATAAAPIPAAAAGATTEVPKTGIEHSPYFTTPCSLIQHLFPQSLPLRSCQTERKLTSHRCKEDIPAPPAPAPEVHQKATVNPLPTDAKTTDDHPQPTTTSSSTTNPLAPTSTTGPAFSTTPSQAPQVSEPANVSSAQAVNLHPEAPDGAGGTTTAAAAAAPAPTETTSTAYSGMSATSGPMDSAGFGTHHF